MRLVPFEEVAELVSGVTFKKSDALTSSDVGLTGILRAGNIQDGGYHLDDLVFVSDSFVKDGQRLKKGDILIASSSGSLDVVGKAAFIDTSMSSAFGAFCKVARPRINEILPEYFKYYFYSQNYKRTVRERAEGANINNLNKGDFLSLMIPLPPLEEQKRIAGILDEADRVRKKTQALIDKYDELAQSLFLDMFGDPGKRNLTEFHELGSLSILVTDGDHATPRREKDGHKLLSCRNVKMNNLDFGAGLDFVGDAEFERMSKRCAAREGDVLISCSGSIGRTLVIHGEEQYVMVRSVALVRPDCERIMPNYVARFLQTPYLQAVMKKCANASSQANLFIGQIKKLPVHVPSMKQQKKFDESILSIENGKTQSQQLLQRQEYFFNALLQKAFKGELT